MMNTIVEVPRAPDRIGVVMKLFPDKWPIVLLIGCRGFQCDKVLTLRFYWSCCELRVVVVCTFQETAVPSSGAHVSA